MAWESLGLPAVERVWEWELQVIFPSDSMAWELYPFWFSTEWLECGSCIRTTAGEQILVFVLWLLECADMKDRSIVWVYYKLLIVPYI